MKNPSHHSRRQGGMTLLIAMIILVMITLLAVSAYRVSNTNLKVVGSMQGRQEGLAASQAVIEQVLSTLQFTRAPGAVASAHWGIDINGDGNEDFDVKLSPQPRCIRTAPVVIGTNPKPEDYPCIGSAVLGKAHMSSYCADTIWEITATTTDKLTASNTTVRQGVSVRVGVDDASSSCS
ncbi:MAG TPA: pilus assembly PilX N-terminal domain-containing protein [Usitatibacter sp.]|nr:pilus assembly PilX N-terminal domain-containing protein [Usitatibacter sp.]